jgi:hypothetical protein
MLLKLLYEFGCGPADFSASMKFCDFMLFIYSKKAWFGDSKNLLFNSFPSMDFSGQ